MLNPHPQPWPSTLNPDSHTPTLKPSNPSSCSPNPDHLTLFEPSTLTPPLHPSGVASSLRAALASLAAAASSSLQLLAGPSSLQPSSLQLLSSGREDEVLRGGTHQPPPGCSSGGSSGPPAVLAEPPPGLLSEEAPPSLTSEPTSPLSSSTTSSPPPSPLPPAPPPSCNLLVRRSELLKLQRIVRVGNLDGRGGGEGGGGAGQGAGGGAGGAPGAAGGGYPGEVAEALQHGAVVQNCLACCPSSSLLAVARGGYVGFLDLEQHAAEMVAPCLARPVCEGGGDARYVRGKGTLGM